MSAACRQGCGACCIAASITTPFLGMTGGKPAGVPCIHLTPDMACALYGRPERPACCAALRPEPGICGNSRDDALRLISALEQLTAPRSGTNR